MTSEIPVGATVELRNSHDSGRVVSYYDNERPKFCRQYCIMNLNTGETRRAFKNELFEKNTSNIHEVYKFFAEQMNEESLNSGAEEVAVPDSTDRDTYGANETVGQTNSSSPKAK